jgi:hypothetical protein
MYSSQGNAATTRFDANCRLWEQFGADLVSADIHQHSNLYVSFNTSRRQFHVNVCTRRQRLLEQFELKFIAPVLE